MKFKLLLLLFTLRVFIVEAQSTDVRLLEKFNSPYHVGPDKTWRFITSATIPIDFAVPITMYLVGLKNEDQDLKIKSYETMASLFIAGGSGFLLKEIVRRQRPYITYPTLIYKKQNETGYSFPSGHSFLAFSTATSLSLSFPKWYVIAPAFTFAAITGYSRLYLGVHYPSDVLGGAIIGVGSSFLSWELQKLISKNSLHHFKF